MGREFIGTFDKWAENYDRSVAGQSPEYLEVFKNYNEILDRVASCAEGTVLEFGTGTGNLTEKLIQHGRTVFGIEPSAKMREKAKEKIADIHLTDGDFINFPRPKQPIDSIVSSYAFHHLTDNEKREALAIYRQILTENGKIVFADTMFDNLTEKRRIDQWAQDQGFMNLLKDLQTEYYPLRADLYRDFRMNHFIPSFSQLNRFVWLIVAVPEKSTAAH